MIRLVVLLFCLALVWTAATARPSPACDPFGLEHAPSDVAAVAEPTRVEGEAPRLVPTKSVDCEEVLGATSLDAPPPPPAPAFAALPNPSPPSGPASVPADPRLLLAALFVWLFTRNGS